MITHKYGISEVLVEEDARRNRADQEGSGFIIGKYLGFGAGALALLAVAIILGNSLI